MSTDDFQKRLQRIHKTGEPALDAFDEMGEPAPRVVAPKSAAPSTASVNKMLSRALAFCVVAAIAIIGLFGMESFRSGDEETAEVAAAKPVVRRMN